MKVPEITPKPGNCSACASCHPAMLPHLFLAQWWQTPVSCDQLEVNVRFRCGVWMYSGGFWCFNVVLRTPQLKNCPDFKTVFPERLLEFQVTNYSLYDICQALASGISLLKQRPGHKRDYQTLFLPHKDSRSIKVTEFVDKTLGPSQPNQLKFCFNNGTFHIVLL